MIIARLKKKEADDGRKYLVGRTLIDVRKNIMVVMMKSETHPGQYEFVELGPRRGGNCAFELAPAAILPDFTEEYDATEANGKGQGELPSKQSTDGSQGAEAKAP